jgi:hypothetical protein
LGGGRVRKSRLRKIRARRRCHFSGRSWEFFLRGGRSDRSWDYCPRKKRPIILAKPA